jgi:hypothetical protein
MKVINADMFKHRQYFYQRFHMAKENKL